MADLPEVGLAISISITIIIIISSIISCITITMSL